MTRVLMMATAVALAGGCAANQPPKSTEAPGIPKVGWVIMQGSADNPDEEFVCQSEPRTQCEMTASRNGRQIFSEVHLYFHPVATQARYEGTAGVEFLGTGKAMQVNVPVKAGGDVGNHSIVGIVTDKPGEYALDLAMAVSSPDGQSAIKDRIPVLVK